MADVAYAPADDTPQADARALQGCIDVAAASLIEGWVWDPQAPDECIRLELLQGDRILATTRADRDRPALVEAGVRDGRHAFRIDLPPGLVARDGPALRLRCAVSGAAVPGSPFTPEPGPPPARLRWHIDEITDAGVVGWVFAPAEPSRRCVVALREGAALHARAVAGRFRPGLREAGLGDGRCAFLLPLAHTLLDGEDHALDVVEEHSGQSLTPQGLAWRSTAGTAGLALTRRPEPPEEEAPPAGPVALHTARSEGDVTVAAEAGNTVDKYRLVQLRSGCIDFFSHSGQLGGWITCGWIGLDWDDGDENLTCTLTFDEEEEITVEGTICLHPRADVKKFGLGFVLWVAGQGRRRDLQGLILHSQGSSWRLPLSQSLERLAEAEAISRSKAHLQGAARSDRRASLLKRLSRMAYAGRDTIESLTLPVLIELDSIHLCPPDGLLVRGWFADPFHQVARIRLRCGTGSALLDPASWITIPRPDVAEALGVKYGFGNERCGFLAFAAEVFSPGDILYFELETHPGNVVFKRVQEQPRSPGIAAVKDVLGCFDLRYGELVSGYDHVVGPGLAAINAFRLSSPPRYTRLEFGCAPEHPRCSIIVPLYGRIDFMEYQLAFFSRTLAIDHELIYVLDDPTRLRATETLAASCLARFQRPFTLVTLAANLGYAPANNVGLGLARGAYVCFLNSDVFPKCVDWLESMLHTAARHPETGAVGARLLFEDGTIQHEGCTFARLQEFGDWRFGLHPDKGLKPDAAGGITEVEGVTGACLLMPTVLARRLGGFDEGYILGDFEDVDLCCKVRAEGLTCVVDRDAQLYHLERQSQGGQQAPWRLNLTLYNAWRFQHRWPESERQETA